MELNVGSTDRIVRIGVGFVLLVIGILGYVGTIPVAVGPLPQALTSLVLLVLGAILLVTGLMRTCPLYQALGLSTSGQ